MKSAIRAMSYLLVLGVGIGIGHYLHFRLSQASGLAFDMGETAYYLAYFKTQMSEGTDISREEAIRVFLALNEKRKEHPTALHTKKLLATDAALAYARLAALAQKRGAIDEAQQYLNRAASYCPQLGWQECSAGKLAEMVRRLDKNGIFRPEGTK